MKRAPTRSRPAPRQYPWYFRVITLSLPFLLLAAVEGTFRLAGVARPPALFIRVPAGPHTFLQLNPKIGQRFFPPSMGSGIPVPNFQVCLADKPAGIRRVLCLGESTTAGFPYPEHGSFPALLRTILQERDPGQQWEVLNCGMTGISARTVADLMPELLSVQPDVIVVYLGHNEFYGVGGVGSCGISGWCAGCRRDSRPKKEPPGRAR